MLVPGQHVKLRATGEVGVVVHAWLHDELGEIDVYVAFFGSNFPVGEPLDPPYVLRYLESSLDVVD